MYREQYRGYAYTDVRVQRVNEWYSVCSILSKPHQFIFKKFWNEALLLKLGPAAGS